MNCSILLDDSEKTRRLGRMVGMVAMVPVEEESAAAVLVVVVVVVVVVLVVNVFDAVASDCVEHGGVVVPTVRPRATTTTKNQ